MGGGWARSSSAFAAGFAGRSGVDEGGSMAVMFEHLEARCAGALVELIRSLPEGYRGVLVVSPPMDDGAGSVTATVSEAEAEELLTEAIEMLHGDSGDPARER